MKLTDIDKDVSPRARIASVGSDALRQKSVEICVRMKSLEYLRTERVGHDDRAQVATMLDLICNHVAYTPPMTAARPTRFLIPIEGSDANAPASQSVLSSMECRLQHGLRAAYIVNHDTYVKEGTIPVVTTLGRGQWPVQLVLHLARYEVRMETWSRIRGASVNSWLQRKGVLCTIRKCSTRLVDCR